VADLEDRLRQRATDGWDPDQIEAAEICAQQERLFIQAAMETGKGTSWDYQPTFDASKQYTR
jgi:choline-sulfatase